MEFVIWGISSITAILLIIIIISWFGWNECCSVKMTWKDIMKFSAVNPDKWYFDANYISYSLPKGEIRYISLSFIDYLTYILHFHGIEKREKQRQNNKVMENILKDIQKDIQKLQAKSDKEIQQAYKTMKELVEK